MDGARCHMTEAVRDAFKKIKTGLAYIPGGMTPILQPLDTHLNRPLKDFVRKQWEEWMLNGEEVILVLLNKHTCTFIFICINL
jgi:hypothetical protein